MSSFCSVCEKSFSRKDSMQRHVMSKHRNATLTPFHPVPWNAFTKVSAVSFRASFCIHGYRNHRFRKNGLGSISITTSFRSQLSYPGEDRLVLFIMATCIHGNASRHSTH